VLHVYRDRKFIRCAFVLDHWRVRHLKPPNEPFTANSHTRINIDFCLQGRRLRRVFVVEAATATTSTREGYEGEQEQEQQEEELLFPFPPQN